MRGRLLGYPISVVEGVGDEFINVRENLTTRNSQFIDKNYRRIKFCW